MNIYKRIHALFVLLLALFVLLLAKNANLQSLLEVNETKSSPSHVFKMKGATAWLHWNYTYAGDRDGGFFNFKLREQVIKYNSATNQHMQILAKRIGQRGLLKLVKPIPSPLAGRVAVISSNSTLVIRDLQYNDSIYRFATHVTVDVDNTPHSFPLKTVSIIVQGSPTFINQPPDELKVDENLPLQFSVIMDGSPKPSADFRWPHLISSYEPNVSSVEVYPFIYSSTYTLKSINASFCGRMLKITIKNSIGSVTVRIIFTVMMKFNMAFGLKVERIAEWKCVEVKWNKATSGACNVTYDISIKSVSGNIVYDGTGYNIGKMKVCNLTDYSNITDVQLTVSFESTSKPMIFIVMAVPISTSLPSTSAGQFSKHDASLSSSLSVTPGILTSSSNTTTKPSDSRKKSLLIAATSVVIPACRIILIIVLYCIIKRRNRINHHHSNGASDTRNGEDQLHQFSSESQDDANSNSAIRHDETTSL